jgi:hypothetical protein
MTEDTIRSEPQEGPFDPNRYELRSKDLQSWNDWLYERLGDGQRSRLRRIGITVALGVVIYGIGFGLAAECGFLSTYLSTVPVYVFVLLVMVLAARRRAGKYSLLALLNKSRGIFIVEDVPFHDIMTEQARRVVAPAWQLLLLLVAAPFLWTLIYLGLFYTRLPAPLSDTGRLITGLEPPTMDRSWFTEPNLPWKVILIAWFVLVALVNIIPAVGLTLTLPARWLRAVKSFAIVPIPAVVSARLQGLAEFFITGSVGYAIGVFGIVILYGGRREAPLIATVSALVLLGILSVLLPLWVIERLTARSRTQLAVALTSEYYQDVYPYGAAGGEISTMSALQRDGSASTKLLGLQELMHETNEASPSEYRLEVLVPALVAQGLPLLGFLFPELSRFLH